MAQVGTNATGQPVFVGDQCTITGVVASISGSGSTANVTVTTDKADSIVVKPGDCGSETAGGPNATQDSTSANPVQNNDGGRFAANSRVSVSGIVLGYVSGAGSTSQLSIKLASSQGSVTVSAGTLRSVPSQAGSFNT
jgi:hypothetical protein